MVDAGDAQQVQRFANIVGRTFLARMRDRRQSLISRAVEDLFKL